MFVYSKKIALFVESVKKNISFILTKETGLKVRGNRFYNKQESISYPINIVIFNDLSCLGYFKSNFYELGFHESCMLFSQEKLYNLLRHELAHYLTFIKHGSDLQPHGIEFRNLCKSFGWEKEVYEATTSLENAPSFIQENALLRKIEKLLALSSSSNTHEAELAMLKSRELLLKHNIEQPVTELVDNEKVFLKRVLKAKKRNAKMEAIAKILETFFVSAVFHKGTEYIYLEILGELANVEIAEYVAKTLDFDLDLLWSQTKLEKNLSGVVAKNSFFLGVAIGYLNKISALKKEYPFRIKQAVLVIEKKLEFAKNLAYGRVQNSSRRGNYCPVSGSLGEHAGKSLSIRPGLTNPTEKREHAKLLSHES